MLSRLNNNFSPFQWRLLSRVLHWMYEHFPVVDWWAVCSVVTACVSGFVYVYVVHQRYPPMYAALISLSLLALLWLVAFFRVNFTRTASTAVIAGILLIANGLFPDRGMKRSLVEYVFGCGLLLLGASIRSDCAYFALVFLAVIGLAMLLRDNFSFKLSWFRAHLLQICLLCLCVVIFFGASVLNQVQLTPEQKEYVEYNTLRASINDYASCYPTYEEEPSAYLNAGWSEAARSAFFNWFSEDTNVFTVNAMEQVRELYEPQQDYSNLSKLIDSNPQLVMLAFFLLLFLCCYRKPNWIYSLSACITLLLLCVYLVSKGRFLSRVYQPIMLGAVCSAVFLCGTEDLKKAIPKEPFGPVVNLHYMYRFSAVLLITGLIVNVVFGATTIHTQYLNTKESRSPTAQMTLAEEHRPVFDAINEDSEHIYIFDTVENPSSMSNAFTFWEIRPLAYCQNRFSLGGWYARSPYCVKQLAFYGITNPATALFENTSVYSTYSSRLLKHLRAYYDPAITVSGTNNFNDIQYVQYTAPIDDALLVSDPEKTVVIEDFHFSDAHFSGTWDLTATISDEAPHERIFYCNITNKDVRYTYRLKCEGNTLTGTFYNLKDHYNADLTQFRIFEKTADGYVEYTKISSPDNPLMITTQPTDVKHKKGVVFDITVVAQGDDLTYKWYYKDKDASDFAYSSSFKGDTYSIEMTHERDGRQIYCVISDKYGCTVQSDTVTMRLAKS